MTPRSFIRGGPGPYLPPAEVAAALREALDADGQVEILDEVGGVGAVAFTLHVLGHSVVARAPGGRRLGTFADALIGVQHAFATLDREAANRTALSRRRRRSCRGTATGGPVG